jgi:integrase
MLLIYAAGLRIEEACSLTPEDVDLETGLIEIRDTKTGDDEYTDTDTLVELHA